MTRALKCDPRFAAREKVGAKGEREIEKYLDEAAQGLNEANVTGDKEAERDELDDDGSSQGRGYINDLSGSTRAARRLAAAVAAASASRASAATQ